MLRRLYDWVLHLSEHRFAPSALFGVSFAESSFFPVPPDLMLIPMILADRLKAWRFAIICTVGSVLGGVFGYFIGALLLDVIGTPIIAFYGLEDKMQSLSQSYQDNGVWIVLLAGFTPIPYKVFTIASGVAALNLPAFIIASFVGRGARFFLLAGLLYFFGPAVRSFIERYLWAVTLVGGVLLVGGFFAIKFLI